MRDALSVLGWGVVVSPILGILYWLWYRLAGVRSARPPRTAGVVVLVGSLFLSASLLTLMVLLYAVAAAVR